MSAELEQLLKKRFITIYSIWGAMLLSIFVYAGVCFKAVEVQSDIPASNLMDCFSNPMTQVLVLVSVVIGFLHFFIPQFILKAQLTATRRQIDLLSHMEVFKGLRGNAVWSEQDLQMAKSLSQEELFCLAMLPKWTICFILSLALAESIVVFGLVLSFVFHSFAIVLPFASAGVFLFLLRFPRPEKFFTDINSWLKLPQP